MDYKNQNKMDLGKVDQNEDNKKHKPPSKIRRDWLRSKMYWSRKLGRESIKEEDSRETTKVPCGSAGKKQMERYGRGSAN